MIEIIEVATSEIGLIREMAMKAFPHTYKEILSAGQIEFMMEWMYSETSLKEQFLSGHRFFIAFSDGVPCGYMSVQKESDSVLHLHKIYVIPDLQGRGVGGALFDSAVSNARTFMAGGARMDLNVNRANKAMGFYLRKGMYQSGSGDFDIGNGYFMNDYIMSLDL